MSSPKRILHVVVSPASAVNLDAMERVLNQATDWAYYLPGAVLIKTGRSASTWSQRLRAVLPDKTHIFVVRVDTTDRGGWLPKWVWEWMSEATEAPSEPGHNAIARL